MHLKRKTTKHSKPRKLQKELISDMAEDTDAQPKPATSNMTRMLSFESLSDSQVQALQDFHHRVEDIPFLLAERPQPDYDTPRLIDDEEYLLRWLVARDFDVDAAEEMIRSHAKWREEMGADTILDGSYCPREAIVKYFPAGWHKHSREGCPIFIERVGMFDAKGIMYSCPLRELLVLKAYHGEKHLQLIREARRKFDCDVSKVIIIIDMDGFGMKHLWRPGIQLAKTISHQFQDNYPEIAKHFLITNPPRIFPIAFNLVKPILNKRVQEKSEFSVLTFCDLLLCL